MSKHDKVVIRALDHGVAEMSINRGPVNALTPNFLANIAAELDGLEADADVRAIVLTSPFKVFSAGLDLKEAQDFDLDQQNAIVAGLNITFSRLYAFPKPVVAAVNGAAIAGGLFFVLGADHRIAVPGAKLGLAEVRVGATFPAGPLVIAQEELGTSGARRLMLGGQPVPAEEAVRMNFVDRIVDPDALMGEAVATARSFAAIPPKTYAAVKAQLRSAALDRINAAMAAGANAPDGGWFNDETRPAMRAMIG